MPEWLAPWVIVLICFWPLYWVEGWIHKHIQGLGLLITDNPQVATLIYYLIFLPGVALHEGSQWLLAKALRVKVKKFSLWPEETSDGMLRLGLVDIDEDTDDLRATLIGIIPFVTGVIVITLIANWRFDVGILAEAFATGEPPAIMEGIRAFMSAPDFFLWMYLIFAIANAMLPEPHDRVIWWLPLPALGGLIILLLVLDLWILILATLEGPLLAVGRRLSLALGLSLGIDLVMMGIIAAAEEIFSRILDREVEYQ